MHSLPQAVILAGGRGRRLGSLTRTVPKPIVMVRGLPFLAYLLRLLRSQGFRRIILCAGYLHEKVRDCLGDGRAFGVEIAYSVEDRPLGTGGAVKRAAPLIEGDFLLLNGDTFLPLDYRRFYAEFQRRRLPGLLAVYANRDRALETNNVRVRSGRVVEYSRASSTPKGHVDAGAGLFRREVLGVFPNQEAFSFEEKVYPALIRRSSLGVYLTRRRYYDIGTPERLRRFEAHAASLQASRPAQFPLGKNKPRSNVALTTRN